MLSIKRTLTTTLAIAASITAMSISASAHADTTIGSAWAVRTNSDLNCAVGGACERASKSSGKIYEAYNFSVTPYNGFSITQSVEGMLYRIGDTKASFNTKSGVKNGIGRSSGAGIFYKVDLGTDEFGVVARIGSNFSRGSVDYVGGGSDSDKSWFAPAGGLGVRYNLNKNWTLTADWDRLPTKYNSTASKSKNDMYSLGVAYKF